MADLHGFSATLEVVWEGCSEVVKLGA
jgi:hypothetical protein